MTSGSSVCSAPPLSEGERRSFAIGFFFVFLLSVFVGALLFPLFSFAFSDLVTEKISGHFSCSFSSFPGFLAEAFRRALPDIRQLLLLLLIGFSYLSGFFVRLLFLLRGLSFGLCAVPVLRLASAGAVKRSHAAVFFLCFSMFGVFLIPATVFFRGFTAAFSVTSVVGLYASHGALLAASVFGVSAVFSIPGFLILSVASLGVSRRLFASVARGEAGRVFGAEYFMITAACFAVSVIPALYRIYLLPGIVSNLL